MDQDTFNILTIINSIVITIAPLAFFRRQKLQEIKYKEIMELNIKAHDITKRADKTLHDSHTISQRDYDRLDYLISRFRKHNPKLSNEIQSYKNLWDKAVKKSKKGNLSKRSSRSFERSILSISESIRKQADDLLK